MKYQFEFTKAYKIKKSPDGRFFATIGNSLTIWNAYNGKKVYTFSQIKNPSEINFSYDGKLVAVKNTSGKIGLYDQTEMKFLWSIQPTKSEGCEVFFTPDNRYIISADWDGYIYIVDITQKSVSILKKDTLFYLSLEYRNNQFIFHGMKTVKNRNHSLIEFWRYPFNGSQTAIIESKTEYDIVTFAGDCRKYIAIDGYKRAILVIDESLPHTHKTLYMYNEKGKKLDIIFAAWSYDGKRFVMIGQGRVEKPNIVKVMDYESLDVIAQYDIPYACYAEITDDGTQLLIGTMEKGYCISLNEMLENEEAPTLTMDEIRKYIIEEGLSEEFLRDVSENELLEALFSISDDMVSNTAKRMDCDESEALKSVPDLNRLTYLVYWFANETSEGGLSQYIFNSECLLCEPLKYAFSTLGLPFHVAIIDEAVELYRTERNIDDLKWVKIDDKCEALDEDPISSLIKFIKRNTTNHKN